MASEDLNSFCQFGGHDSKTSRTGHQFYYEWKAPLRDDSLHIWLMCEQCALILLKHPDPTMAILSSQALSLAKECYSMKLELLTNATVVDDAIRFVSDHENQKN